MGSLISMSCGNGCHFLLGQTGKYYERPLRHLAIANIIEDKRTRHYPTGPQS